VLKIVHHWSTGIMIRQNSVIINRMVPTHTYTHKTEAEEKENTSRLGLIQYVN